MSTTEPVATDSTADSASGGKKLRPQRTNATKQRLFEASMELIGERGAAGVTVDEIAAAAGVSKGTVYYNFGSKSDLIAQLLRHGVDIMLARLQAIEAQSNDPLESMTNMVDQAMVFMDKYPSFARLWVSENWRMPGEWSSVFTELRAELLAVIGAAVERVAAGYQVDTSIARGSLEAAIFGAIFVVGLDRQTYNPERSREQCVAAVMTIMHGYVIK
ncbi:TetR/AcrR family transcriptional regulator [Arthrobacter sp. efr-133-TYG-104]|uniref:TetR/AcrR family transcriptional regulator n=1 Tax=Arthrobacter sp. efr-133-TYG-104 TaxID=3040324 RepID=UPI002550DDA2|nr:TetR/AcrR family transcriptional regulator [Arthrobacter sp. efr-133-TYG-104]